MKDKDKKQAKDLMKHNNVKELYFCDGSFFLKKNEAQNHSLRAASGKRREKALKVEKITSEMLEDRSKKTEDGGKKTEVEK